MPEDLFQGWHLVILVLLVVLLFGGKRLPEVARGLGQSLRVFKAEVKAPVEEQDSRPEPRAVEAAPETVEPTDTGTPVIPVREARER